MKNDNVYYLKQKKYKNKYKNKYKKQKSFKIYLLVFILLFIFGLILFTRDRSTIVSVGYGQVVDGFNTKGLIIRDENVYFTPYSGQISLKKGEGQRIAYGQVVMEINTVAETKAIYNYQAGIISYAFDGLEEKLTPSNLSKLTKDDLDNLSRNYQQLTEGDYLGKNNKAFRIINNNYLVLIIKTDRQEVQRYYHNELVFIRDKQLKTDLIRAKIIDRVIYDNHGYLVVKLERYLSEWNNLRWVEIDFIKNIHRGVVVPRQAIFRQQEGQGVLVSISGSKQLQFKKVDILEGNNEKVIVRGLNIGDNVIKDPATVNYGQGRL